MDDAENRASIVKEASLLIHCLAMDVLLLRAFASAGVFLPSRCVAIGIHVTIFYFQTVLIWYVYFPPKVRDQFLLHTKLLEE
jgi:hypothetical protein